MTRRITEAERAEWEGAMRHVRRRGGAPAAAPAVAPPPPPAPPSAHERAVPVAPARGAPLFVGTRPPGLDTATWERFRTGRAAPQRTLDLHGRTLQAAFQALATFLGRAHADRVRVVEVVTGGDAARGAIRREVQVWLNLPELRPLVLAAAHPHASNPGAVRLLLRRLR